jgi:hypothetical protein
MGSKEVKNFKHAVFLAMSQPDLGCPILDLYYNSPSESIKQYITFVKCNYCYKYCQMSYLECLESIRYLYHNGYMSLSDFRVVLGRFLALKRKGLLS